jgi:butyrate kinase
MEGVVELTARVHAGVATVHLEMLRTVRADVTGMHCCQLGHVWTRNVIG